MDFPYGTIAVDRDGYRYMVLAPFVDRPNHLPLLYHLLVVGAPVNEPPWSSVGSLTSSGRDWLAAHVIEKAP